MEPITTIAYLAPEIPALSATFVYHEILALQHRGLTIVPISVHYPQAIAETPTVDSLRQTTTYLYRQSGLTILWNSITALWHFPVGYLRALHYVWTDMVTLGLIKPLAIKLLYQFIQAGSVAQILRTQSCQHLHIHFAHVPTQIGMYAATIAGIPFTFTAHANDLFERGVLLKQKVERAHWAITISDYNYQFLTSRAGAPPDKIRIVRCGIDTHQYQFTPTAFFRHTPPRLGSLGRLVEKKGMDSLILAVAQLRHEGMDCYLEIAGDGPWLTRLQALVAREGLGDRVRFRGAMRHDQVFDWMRGLDVFVLACRPDAQGDQDGIPVVLMEAMAIGTPVCSTRLSGIPELIVPGAGLLANPNDPASLAAELAHLLSHPAMLAEMTHIARHRIETEFAQSVNLDRLLEIFHSSTHVTPHP